MDRKDLERELARFDGTLPIERASTPPSSWFTTPEIHELERRAVFGRSWHPVARSEQLREPGAFVTGCLFGEPWLVVRGADDELRGFRNTCRHKGREVIKGSGTTRELVCGYHAWTYDLEGRLRRAPRMAGIEDFDRAEMSLPALALESWGPWVFINMDVHAAPFAPRVQEVTECLAGSGWERMRYFDSRTWTIECNWKVVVDNYLDGGYHIPFMHPTLDAQIDMESYRTEVFEHSSIQTSRPARAKDDRIEFDAAGRIGDAAHYAWIYPNFMLNRYGPCLDTNYVKPLGPNRCEVHYEFFFEETAGQDVEQFMAESIEQSCVTQREDIAICESVQVGLASGGYECGRYAPRVEMGEYHFHRLLAQDLRATLRD